MWEAYREVVQQYPRLPLAAERRLIALAQRGVKASQDELVLRHVGFVIWRLCKKVFRPHLQRHGEDMLSAAIPLLYQKVWTYNLNYRDRDGNKRPVRFSSYIWKRIDGFAIDFLRSEKRTAVLNEACLADESR
ncbi:MAG: hypothetical protein NTY77_05170 [Elusimicrobia bacterium]|nr:hypothetical protein [Elusimicrobiota bacterium]